MWAMEEILNFVVAMLKKKKKEGNRKLIFFNPSYPKILSQYLKNY